jgi:hypothetical protein
MNINDYIYFKPTASGENILFNYEYLTDSERLADNMGFHRMQFWVFCDIFGKHFNMGSNQFFVNNEVLFKNPVKESENK